jgi:hypothetical protein
LNVWIWLKWYQQWSALSPLAARTGRYWAYLVKDSKMIAIQTWKMP